MIKENEMKKMKKMKNQWEKLLFISLDIFVVVVESILFFVSGPT